MPHHLLRNEKTNSTHWKAEGTMDNDYKYINACQQECAQRIATKIRLDNEAYLLQHPEIKAMMKSCLGSSVLQSTRNGALKDTALYFTNPIEKLENDIKKVLKERSDQPYLSSIGLEDKDLGEDIVKIIRKHYPDTPIEIPFTEVTTPATVSSSFISIFTSEMTLPTPEPTPIPEPTMTEILYKMILNTMDKATLTGITEDDILYDAAYVELMKIVENAMEIPVVEIRQDIGNLLDLAYRIFECYVEEKERQAAELAWERRMRKKLKRTIRRQNNFKGYETPPTPKSEVSSHASYKVAPPRPCVCHPQWTYNRYPKDRFGIYLARDIVFEDKNLTTTPVISLENLLQDEKEPANNNS